MHLLFWLSLVPVVTGWVGENRAASAPAALYGVVLFMAGVAWLLLQRAIIAVHGHDSELQHAIGGDLKGKLSGDLLRLGDRPRLRLALDLYAIYIAVAVMWFVSRPPLRARCPARRGLPGGDAPALKREAPSAGGGWAASPAVGWMSVLPPPACTGMPSRHGRRPKTAGARALTPPVRPRGRSR